MDYPKSGTPVDMADTPRFLIPYKPDWKSDEVINPRKTDYYVSNRAIGHLFRSITLEEGTKELSYDPRTSALKDKPKTADPHPAPLDSITSTLSPILETYTQYSPEASYVTNIPVLFNKYCLQLKYICLTHTLSHDPDIKLREEEVVVGTILAKCSQARWRKDRIEEMRINVSQLVRLVSTELRGTSTVESLARAWTAWNYTQAHRDEFGHQSFGLIALGNVFRALDELQDSKVVD